MKMRNEDIETYMPCTDHMVALNCNPKEQREKVLLKNVMEPLPDGRKQMVFSKVRIVLCP
jgi:hypothetical protein